MTEENKNLLNKIKITITCEDINAGEATVEFVSEAQLNNLTGLDFVRAMLNANLGDKLKDQLKLVEEEHIKRWDIAGEA